MKLWVRWSSSTCARNSAGSQRGSGTLRLPRTKWASIFDPLPWAIEATWTIASPGRGSISLASMLRVPASRAPNVVVAPFGRPVVPEV